LMLELQTCKNAERAVVIITQIDEMYNRDKLLGFAEHPEVLKQETPEERQAMQDKFQLASTYSDEWCSTVVEGETVYIRFYFICQRQTNHLKYEKGAVGRCMHLTMSKDWPLKLAEYYQQQQQPGQEHVAQKLDAWTSGGWKCVCNAGYQTNSGCLVEMKIPGVPGMCYARSAVPDQHIMDIRAMFHEKTIKPATAEELYMKVPRIAPSTTEVVKKSMTYKGWWYVDHKTFDELVELDWYTVFSLFGIEIEEHYTKKQTKARDKIIWGTNVEDKKKLRQADEQRAAQRRANTVSAVKHFLQGGASASSSNM